MIGMPFVTRDEIWNRRVENRDKRPWEQTGIDEKGHRRFEGAFEGGNVAGYWNTCGSKEGWNPSSFVSSRDVPTKIKKQTVFDFMDEEDIGDYRVGHTISPNVDFSAPTRQTLSGVSEDISSSIEEKISNVRYSTVGRKMLIRMKALRYENSQNVEEDNKFVISSTHTVSDIKKNIPKQKNDFCGLGYQATSIEENKTSNFFDPKIGAMRDGQANRIAMKSIYEEGSEDEYLNYNNEIVETDQMLEPKPLQEEDFHISVHDFEPGGVLQIQSRHFPLPEISSDFVFHPTTPKFCTKPPQQMDADKRSLLLGETEKLHLTHSERQSIVERFSRFTKAEPLLDKDIVISLPFVGDSAKIARFKAFVADKKGLKLSAQPGGAIARGSSLLNENREFEKLFQENEEELKKSQKQSTKTGIKQQIQQIEDKLKKKSVETWRPEPLLCERFEVLNPFDTNTKKHKTEEPTIHHPALPKDGNEFFAEVKESYFNES